MKTRSLLLSCLLLLAAININAKDKNIDSEIDKVTVYFQGAHVSRTAQTSLPSGEMKLIFTGISQDLQTQSLQVEGIGNFKILSIMHRFDYLNEGLKSDEILAMMHRADSLKKTIEYEESLKKVLMIEEDMIISNKSIGGQQEGVIIEDLKEASVFFRTRLSEIRLEMLNIDRKVRICQAEIGMINKQIGELNLKRGKTTSEVIVNVVAEKATQASFLISYMVNNARWYPTYDLRVKDIESPINVELVANVVQSSGELWDNVKLSLTSADPTKSSIKPGLTPYYIGSGYSSPRITGITATTAGSYTTNRFSAVSGRVYDRRTSQPVAFASVLSNGSNPVGTTTDFNGNFVLNNIPPDATNLIINYVGYQSVNQPINAANYNIALGESTVQLDAVEIKRAPAMGYGESWQIQSQPVTVAQSRYIALVNYEIEEPYSIPSDGKNYMVNVTSFTMNAEYEYSCVPKLDPDVFLMAKVDDWEDKNILKGSVNLFYEGKYVGNSVLDPEGSGDTLLISLGRDQEISVKRILMKEYCSKQFIGSNKKDDVAYRIVVRNNKKQSINLIVEDQFPVSNNKDIEVSRKEWSDAELDDNTGLLKWNLKLSSGQEQKLDMQYVVKYPSKMNVYVY